MVVVTWGALVVAVNGFITLFTGLEVVPLAGAGPLVEPVSVLVAFLALLVLFLRQRGGASGWLPLTAGVIAYLAIVLVGALGYLLARGAPADGLLYAAAAAGSVFTLADAALAAAAGLAFLLLLRARQAGAHRPRWPWERDEDP